MTYRAFQIRKNTWPPPIPQWRQFQIEYIHPDYDLDDPRYGLVSSIAEAERAIDDYWSDLE